MPTDHSAEQIGIGVKVERREGLAAVYVIGIRE